MNLSNRTRAVFLLALTALGAVVFHLLGDSWLRAGLAALAVVLVSQLLVVVPRLRRGLSPWPVSPGRDQARTEA